MLSRSISSTKISKQFRTICITFRKMSTEAPDVILEEINNKGIITLNRPKVLNALDLSMVKKIVPALQKWEKDGKVCVIVKGAGEKSFCAGGDVKNIVLDGMKGGKLGHEFFREEYAMNGMIGNYKIPYIALIDGIVMGGGVGLSVHGKYRVATERSLFAMPETQIGLFPDVGGSYFLPRLKGKIGSYLALTGERLKGADLLKAKIATHYITSNKLQDLENAIVQCQSASEIERTLDKFSIQDNNPFVLEPVIDKIDACFSSNSVEQIFERLEKDGSDWAIKTLGKLKKMSPTSLKVTLKIINEGKKLSLIEALQVEYRVAVGCLSHHDFYEGVRALLVDKDQNPKWKPSTVREVTDDIVDRHFARLSEDKELKHKL
ncbi:3-hydroxyisobutyryl-CoA hydrolase, mitochondrial isoform X1 [Harmonia axyridis]|uniref:3-hydroxyisobutyryl-CoA hydrolase, mitochondrial isoform X1 n=2 Tax=Harmonia axyridis TaxID=115357 RepID=UPI001E27688B|nr:3-hydroxyisobutyryl-CoA hydrolase, mitochondrial isoform X1 [Harmonia axyridis]